MRLRYLLVVAGVLALASQGFAQGCEGWNTSLFFLSATPTEVENCLAAGADVNARSAGLGDTPLHLAARFSANPAIITALLDAGADTTTQDNRGKTPWDYAKDREGLEGSDAYRRLSEASEVQAVAAECAAWNTADFFFWATSATVADCLAAGAEVNTRNADGNTPLQFAAANSTDPTVIRILVGAGAGVNARGGGGWTALHRAAASSDSPTIITALVDAGAEVDARDEDGLTPLHLAALYTDNPTIITALVAAGSDVNARADSGFTPLHMAAYGSDNLAIITALLDAGADATARDDDGNTPWNYAEDREELEGTDAYRRLEEQAVAAECEGWNTSEFFERVTVAGVQVCLEIGADVNARDDEYDATPLHNAAWFNDNPAVITALLNAGADVNARDRAGDTPLHNAARFNDNPAVITALLNAGADAAIQNGVGNTPWNYAEDREELEGSGAYERLAEHAVAAECAEWSTSVFFESATLAEVQACLAAGADVNARSAGLGGTPLHWAGFSSNDPAIIRALVSAGARVNAGDEDGNAPLFYAAQGGTPAVIRALVEAGGDVYARSENGWTPLHHAVLYNDSPAVIRALVSAGAEVNAGDEDGDTPLHLAAYDGDDPAIIRALVIAGAEVNARDEYGFTPLHMATFGNDNPAIITALLDAGADATARDDDGNTPWNYAEDREELEGTDAYRRLEAQAVATDCEGWNTPDFFAFATPAEVRGCLAAGARVSVRDDDGWTTLHIAAVNSNDPAVIRTLLNAGAEVYAREGESGWTPLHTAAIGSDNPAIITALVAAGAEVDARDWDDVTPLHFAAGFNSNPAVTRALVNAGAWLEARVTEFGTTPLHMAASSNDNPAIITALLDAGANGAAQTNWGATPWDLAQDNEALRGTDAWWRLAAARF